MPKSYRIRTKINEDSFVRVNLEQDFDLLEILSLKLTQSEVFSRMCADYGVVVGRVMANGGLGLPNAKVSVFIPLTDEDEKDAVISEMYPFKDVNDKNEEGYRYNLLPKNKQHNRHTPTGSMYSAEETISNPLKLEVYEKYYKYTVKTNDNGDYMIWGVPLGTHQIHMSVDVSDIGCHSMKPFDFIAQGVPIEVFKNAAVFNGSENLDTLPQIVIQNKTLEVVPFWGDDDLCNTGISRTDFDLRDSSVEFKPNALLMGSIISDDNNNNVGWQCKPSKNMGEVCKMTTGSGKIESIRFTVYKEDDGCTPKLEKFNLHSIDGSGSFVARVPMNLDYIYTDEYGNEQISDTVSIGVPSRGKYRFRISFDQKYSSETRKGEYLVPNIREYINDEVRSYSFSEDLYDYPETIPGDPSTIVSSPAFLGQDYFYEFTPDRVYTIGQHIDMYRNDYGNLDFASGAVSPSSTSRPFFRTIGSAIGRNRWEFIGIKSTNPPYESDCSGSIKEFPPNDGFRGGSFIFLMTQLNLFVTQLSVFGPFLLLSITVIISSFQFLQNLGMTLMSAAASMAGALGVGFGFGAVQTVQPGGWVSAAAIIAQALLDVAFQILLANLLVNAMDSLKYNLGLTKFDECENCNCGEFFSLKFSSFWGAAEIDENAGNIVVDDPACQIPPLISGTEMYFSPAHNEEMGDNSSKGCYSISFEGSGFKGAFNTAIWLIATTGIAAVFVPYGVGSWLVVAITKVGIPAFVIWFAVIILKRLGKIFMALNEWRVRKNIYNGLCQGVFNMGFWNSWIRGTLYHFRFTNFKTEYDSGGIIEVDDFYCRDVVIGPPEIANQHYYYRSCPYKESTGKFDIGGRAMTTFNYLAAGGIPATINYKYNKGISYPTTIIELGTFEDMTTNNSCIDCDADVSGDFLIDRMESSSQKSTNGVLDYAINQKMMLYTVNDIIFTGINHWFGGQSPYNLFIWPPMAQGQDGNVRNAGINQPRLLDGDIAQLVSSNNEIGTYKFPSLFYHPQDPNYGPLPPGVVDSRITKTSLKIASVVSDNTLRNLVVGGLNGYPKTQDIPYYGWKKPLASFGNFDNDWDRATVLTASAQPGSTIIPPYAPINNVSPYGALSVGFYHYYFGLYQGNNAYDQFVNKYMPPVE
jgi:hypothetical protein|tara:strand:- start:25979 stop:29401 length:3423 start_codon:yes stop_codon:yes gene_type:complete